MNRSPAVLERFLEVNGHGPSAALDRLCAQKDAHHSRLFWFTDLDEACAEAVRTGRPILSLRLLGRLDEDRSCANSRFFRTTLYPRPEVSRELREGWVLHWQSVRPAPFITVDFGDGRRIERTITGNSAHLVLDARGRMVDAVPGLYGAAAFLRVLRAARSLARETVGLDGAARAQRLARFHAAAERRLRARWASAVGTTADATLEELERNTSAADWARLGGRVEVPEPSVLESKAPTAMQAGGLAMGKMLVERPLLRALAPLAESIALDTGRNEHALHRQVHERFARGAAAPQPDAFTEWLYDEVFLMPPGDPWLGLAPDDAFAALDGAGLVMGP